MVSVIVPIYNMEKLVGRCIESILAQSVSDLQVILVDDGSADQSLKVCREYEKKDGRITVVAQKNGGVSTARNAGLDRAAGEYVMFVDPDDYLDRDIISRLKEAIGDADIAACCCQSEDDQGARTKVSFFDGSCVFTDVAPAQDGAGYPKTELALELLDRECRGHKRPTAIGVPWGKLYRRSFLEKNSLRFDPELIRMQDNIFNMEAFDRANRVVYLDEGLYIYNLGHITKFSRRYDPRSIRYLDKVLRLHFDHYTANGYADDPELRAALDRENIKLSNMMLTMYFLNARAEMTVAQRAEAIRAHFDQAHYRAAFSSASVKSAPAVHRFRIGCVRTGRLRLLILTELAYQRLKH